MISRTSSTKKGTPGVKCLIDSSDFCTHKFQKALLLHTRSQNMIINSSLGSNLLTNTGEIVPTSWELVRAVSCGFNHICKCVQTPR